MTRLDRMLERWRIAKAIPWIPPQAALLDVGCRHGTLLETLGPRLRRGVGIDPLADPTRSHDHLTFHRGRFPDDLPASAPFEVIALLAVLEHIPPGAQPEFLRACHRRLEPGGRLVLTVPSPRVDRVLAVLRALRWVEGMSLGEHYGFTPRAVEPLCAGAGLRRVLHRRFQLGLNHLFVFDKTRA
ncbi:MAG: class I SAM-dependent methyltransferase [Verrucomicrobia bacterium]|nr:class I SAM-dependent methyltransferase [Verrucomicrobiota bacterium]